LQVKDVPVIYVINKSDMMKDQPSLQLNPRLTISALTGDGFDKLMKTIDETLYSKNLTVTLMLPYDKGQIYSFSMERPMPSATILVVEDEKKVADFIDKENLLASIK
ncbi:MAG: hypothetical protein HGB14_03555, partial [Anaerolineaceae bacterium]|nr:hypothetical protein [Anaerolineaceae bacterium]